MNGMIYMKIDQLTIKELKQNLAEMEVSDRLVSRLRQDPRQGVQKLADRYLRILEKRRQARQQWERGNEKVKELLDKGFENIAGVDEAGRGPLAGPVVAAAVILDLQTRIKGVDDSKKIKPARRQELYTDIQQQARAVGIGIVDSQVIDEINILQATFLAMNNALDDLDCQLDHVLVDGNRNIPSLAIKQEAIVEGDSLVNSIAAASIIAKVTRDRIIDDYDRQFPEYNFSSNKGYGTREHIEMIKKYGPCPVHRSSFAVVKKHEQMELFQSN